VVVFKVREYFGYHFGVLGGNSQVLRCDVAFPEERQQLIPIDRSKALLLLALESKAEVICYRLEWDN
jgi:hypothetical protein